MTSFFIQENSEWFGNATGDDGGRGQELAVYLNGFGTKTYLYMENNEFKCINGEVEKEDDYYMIKSFAAYPKEYYFYEKGTSFVSKINAVVPVILFDGQACYKEKPYLLNEKIPQE